MTVTPLRNAVDEVYEGRPRKDHRGVDLIPASHLPNNSAQFSYDSAFVGLLPSKRPD